MWNEVIIKDWVHFYSTITELKSKEWIFRGQASSEWKITSSLFREIDRAKDLIHISGGDWGKKKNQYEEQLIRMFQSQSHLYLSINPDDHLDIIKIIQDGSNNEYVNNKLEWLSLMQHYGAPTRMIDWTFSPFIGLFFAVENARTEFALYSINLTHIISMNKKKFKKEELSKKLFLHVKTSGFFVYPFEPQISNERILKQQGLFIVPSSNYKTFDELLSEYNIKNGFNDQGEIVAYKFIFDKSLIVESIRNLRMMNITPDSLFPGIEGFSRTFKLHLYDSTSNLKRIY
ncbi:FRG domain-containing protein [Paenibacillus barcinonensis]|uniref:FRG domain-containing protein n=1 Tax=Paenibacillus barcinonensis TaxID=198119 RepID=A0A2V4VRX5_PAEBA|nr:FRG domain-containing protein [Paenibacillus barcinonensis]PYE41665.1 FRG domain-containing protein [Paenibacillus barcinonensis]QKS59002.1 FRG domain-containing protein [Paenibacillus barcinonensis]